MWGEPLNVCGTQMQAFVEGRSGVWDASLLHEPQPVKKIGCLGHQRKETAGLSLLGAASLCHWMSLIRWRQASPLQPVQLRSDAFPECGSLSLLPHVPIALFSAAWPSPLTAKAMAPELHVVQIIDTGLYAYITWSPTWVFAPRCARTCDDATAVQNPVSSVFQSWLARSGISNIFNSSSKRWSSWTTCQAPHPIIIIVHTISEMWSPLLPQDEFLVLCYEGSALVSSGCHLRRKPHHQSGPGMPYRNRWGRSVVLR